MSYTRPDGDSADFLLSGGAYVRPLGDVANFGEGSLQAVFPESFSQSVVGEHSARNQHEFISPLGEDFFRAGWNTVRDPEVYARPYGLAVYFLLGAPYTRPGGSEANFGGVSATPTIYPPGYDGAAFGGANIWNYAKRVLAGAIPPANQYGEPGIWLYTRFVVPGGHKSEAIGSQWASHYLRYVLAAGGSDLLSIGGQWVSHSPRDLAPEGFDAMRFLEAHAVGGDQTISPEGTEMTQWGTRIIPEGKAVYPQGFAGEVGSQDIQLFKRFVSPGGFLTNADDLRFGQAHAWNLRQYIKPILDLDDGLSPQGFGQWTAIENRNKEPGPVGWLSERVGYQFIWNKANPMAPPGIAPPENDSWDKAGSVTHWRREVSPPGVDSFDSERWHVAYNNAVLLNPVGNDAQTFGQPALENRSRMYDKVGNFDTMTTGTPMVAERIRELAFESRYSIEPPPPPLPGVMLHTRYVEYVSAGDFAGTGGHVLDIRWTIITPRWTFHPPEWIGWPALHNVTPEVKTWGSNMEEFGGALVRTQWRRVETTEGDMTQWGRATVRDRRQWAEFVTLGAPPTMLPGPKVTKVGGLPEQQAARPSGIPPAAGQRQVPEPQLSILFAYPEGINSAKFGTPTAVANSILIEPGINTMTIGAPAVVAQRREVRVGKFEDAQVFQPSKPRVSPHTIYAVMEAPAQAMANHPVEGRMHYVGYGDYDYKGVGYHSISNRFRSIRPSGFATSDSVVWPSPSIENARRYISVDGWHSFRRGIPLLPSTQKVKMFHQEHYDSFGDTHVGRPPYIGPVTVSPYGSAPPLPTGAVVDFYHRTLKPVGLHSLEVGASSDRDTPYQWKSLHVGPPMPTIPEGFSAEQFGIAWVSLAVRDMPVQGWDSFASEYNIDDFEQRMRVSKTPRSRPVQTLSAQGVAPRTAGAPDIRPAAHYIRPDGNAETYRKGAP